MLDILNYVLELCCICKEMKVSDTLIAFVCCPTVFTSEGTIPSHVITPVIEAVSTAVHTVYSVRVIGTIWWFLFKRIMDNQNMQSKFVFKRIV